MVVNAFREWWSEPAFPERRPAQPPGEEPPTGKAQRPAQPAESRDPHRITPRERRTQATTVFELRIAMLRTNANLQVPMLVGLWEAFASSAGSEELLLDADPVSGTAGVLNSHKMQARQMSQNLQPPMRHPAARQTAAYHFGFGRKGARARIKLIFQDLSTVVPVSVTTQAGVQDQAETVRRAQAAVVLLDARPILEEEIPAAATVTARSIDTELFRDAYCDPEFSWHRLVILAPIVGDREHGMETVWPQFLDSERGVFREFHDLFQQPPLRGRIAVVVAPIRLASAGAPSQEPVEEPRDEPEQNAAYARYEAADCRRPLRYLIRFWLHTYVKPFPKARENLMQDGGELMRLLEQFVSDDMLSAGRTVLQGESLLGMEHD